MGLYFVICLPLINLENIKLKWMGCRYIYKAIDKAFFGVSPPLLKEKQYQYTHYQFHEVLYLFTN